jgi:ribosomal protein S18 acetylase RimI-like enzyme
MTHAENRGTSHAEARPVTVRRGVPEGAEQEVADALDTYGLFKGMPRLALLALLERTPAAHQLVMDGLAVAAEFRGRGIGSLLLSEACRIATAHHCDQIRLDVIDVNLRARSLYERHGFTAVRTEQTPYLRRLMGFSAVITMHRPITPRPGDRP